MGFETGHSRFVGKKGRDRAPQSGILWYQTKFNSSQLGLTWCVHKRHAVRCDQRAPGLARAAIELMKERSKAENAGGYRRSPAARNYRGKLPVAGHVQFLLLDGSQQQLKSEMHVAGWYKQPHSQCHRVSKNLCNKWIQGASHKISVESMAGRDTPTQCMLAP